jgi:hypothetical protein
MPMPGWQLAVPDCSVSSEAARRVLSRAPLAGHPPSVARRAAKKGAAGPAARPISPALPRVIAARAHALQTDGVQAPARPAGRALARRSMPPARRTPPATPCSRACRTAPMEAALPSASTDIPGAKRNGWHGPHAPNRVASASAEAGCCNLSTAHLCGTATALRFASSGAPALLQSLGFGRKPPRRHARQEFSACRRAAALTNRAGV